MTTLRFAAAEAWYDPRRLPGAAHPDRVPRADHLRDTGAAEHGLPARLRRDRRAAQQARTSST